MLDIIICCKINNIYTSLFLYNIVILNIDYSTYRYIYGIYGIYIYIYIYICAVPFNLEKRKVYLI